MVNAKKTFEKELAFFDEASLQPAGQSYHCINFTLLGGI
jgi:hypothetical protein